MACWIKRRERRRRTKRRWFREAANIELLERRELLTIAPLVIDPHLASAETGKLELTGSVVGSGTGLLSVGIDIGADGTDDGTAITNSGVPFHIVADASGYLDPSEVIVAGADIHQDPNRFASAERSFTIYRDIDGQTVAPESGTAQPSEDNLPPIITNFKIEIDEFSDLVLVSGTVEDENPSSVVITITGVSGTTSIGVSEDGSFEKVIVLEDDLTSDLIMATATDEEGLDSESVFEYF